ncbi:hypothetical protein JHK87_024872 [Glycine soja]|nr:hypothetical protein JHK87_024872 [Glycine soja]
MTSFLSIELKNIIIDAKPVVSGAGCSAKENLLFTEVTEGLNSYGATQHRHGRRICCCVGKWSHSSNS